VAVVTAACVASGAVGGTERLVRDAVIRYLDAVASHDARAVCSLLSSAELAKFGGASSCLSGVRQEFQTEVAADRAHQRAMAETARVTTVIRRGRRAAVTIDTRLDGVRVTYRAALVSKGGQWKISVTPHDATAGVDRVYRMPSPSMRPTIQVGALVLVDPAAYRRQAPTIGQIVVFHPPAGADTGTCANPRQGGFGGKQACDRATSATSHQTSLKRIVAEPGDRIAIVNGHVIRNRHRERDSYIAPCHRDPLCNFPTPIVIPAGQYYVLGDNRPDSDDSRFWGPVRRSQLIGPVVRILR
jgi:signal peptidase I